MDLQTPKVAWYNESFHRDDRRFDFASTQDLAGRHYFPAVQDADEFGGQWLPFGVDTNVFRPKPLDKRYDAAFLGQLYPKRAAYLRRVGYPISILPSVIDADPRRSSSLLSDAYGSTRIFVNLPSYSRLLVAKVTEVMACRTLLVTPLVDHPSGARNTEPFQQRKHLVYYSPERPQDIADIVAHYLANHDQRERIAEGGWREISLLHSLRSRMHRIIDDGQATDRSARKMRSLPQPLCSFAETNGQIPPGLYFMISHHLTVCYMTDGDAEIRHAPAGSAALNLMIEVADGNVGRLIATSGPLLERHHIRFVGRSHTERAEPSAAFDCELEALPNGRVGIRARAGYISADPDGVVRNDRAHCREFEQYRLARAGMGFAE
jgi:hypothetical protein